jgi:hypothetical protein
MSIKEKWAIEISAMVRCGASESDVITLLTNYLYEEVGGKIRYDYTDFCEITKHPQGDYIRYDDLLS